MISYKNSHIVGNWNQTFNVQQAITNSLRSSMKGEPKAFFNSLKKLRCGYDAPVFTLRITGYQDELYPNDVFLSIIKADPLSKSIWEKEGENSGLEIFNFPSVNLEYKLKISRGKGYCVTTYMPGSSTLPSFSIDPLEIPLKGTLEKIMNDIWNKLDSRWKVSMGGKEWTIRSYRYAFPINKFK